MCAVIFIRPLPQQPLHLTQVFTEGLFTFMASALTRTCQTRGVALTPVWGTLEYTTCYILVVLDKCLFVALSNLAVGCDCYLICNFKGEVNKWWVLYFKGEAMLPKISVSLPVVFIPFSLWCMASVQMQAAMTDQGEASNRLNPCVWVWVMPSVLNHILTFHPFIRRRPVAACRLYCVWTLRCTQHIPHRHSPARNSSSERWCFSEVAFRAFKMRWLQDMEEKCTRLHTLHSTLCLQV